MSSTLQLEVDAAAAGERLDRFLAEPLGSRARAQALIDAGAVQVDGRLVAKRHLLSAGETVAVVVPDPEVVVPGAQSGEAGAGFEVAYEDEHLLVVDKAAGVVVHPARGHRAGTLSQSLAARGLGVAGGDPARPGIVHRLDRDTSGLLVVSRSEEAHRALSAQLGRRELRREYLVLVEGMPPSRTGTIEAAIGRDRRDRTLMSIDTDAGREARTHFELERLVGTAALLRVVLDTGRTHQIRVHLGAIGLPVAGDPQYGRAGAYGLERQFLHAARLAFTHPLTGEAIDVVSELPEDLRAALARADPDATVD